MDKSEKRFESDIEAFLISTEGGYNNPKMYLTVKNTTATAYTFTEGVYNNDEYGLNAEQPTIAASDETVITTIYTTNLSTGTYYGTYIADFSHISPAPVFKYENSNFVNCYVQSSNRKIGIIDPTRDAFLNVEI